MKRRLYFPELLDRLPKKLLNDTKFIIDFLEKNYGAHCYIVGGAVRDSLLARELSDVDIECFGISKEDFEEAMERVGALGVGKSFFVYKYKDIDISLPRVESKVGYGHRGFEVELASNPKEASRRRDFTINSLMFDTKSSEIVDYWGGIEDLQNSTLRATDHKSFIEDSLRVLRSVQFGARFGLKLDKSTCNLCRGIDLSDIPKERIFKELEKLFDASYLHYGLFILSQVDVDKKIFGFKIDKKSFFKISKALKRYQNNFLPELKRYYFLAILRRFVEFDMEKLLRGIGSPNIYLKKLNINYKKEIDIDYLADLSKKEPICNSVLSYDDEVISLAKEIDIWDKSFDIGVTPKELMDRGFSGKALGEELERARLNRVKELKEFGRLV